MIVIVINNVMFGTPVGVQNKTLWLKYIIYSIKQTNLNKSQQYPQD